MIEKEYRIVMPVSVEEYRHAQVYMTARTSLTEAMSEDGAGVEVLINRPARHPKLGPAQYTKKIFHIDKRFPSWLRMVAPKSGSHLVEESWNAFPHTLTEVTFPVLNSFRITVESHHLPDRGENNPHGIDAAGRKHCEIVRIDIAQSLTADKDQDSSRHHGEDGEEDLSTFRSKCGRGPLVGHWQKIAEPVMCAYKRVSCEMQLWGMQNKTENFMHTYERELFHKASRNTFCWIDEWYGLQMEELRAYEAAVNDRINQITRIKQSDGTGRIRIARLPPVRATDFKHSSTSARACHEDIANTAPAHAKAHASEPVVWPEGKEKILHDIQVRAEAASRRSLVRHTLARSNRVAADDLTEEMWRKGERNQSKPRSVSPAALARTDVRGRCNQGRYRAEDWRGCGVPASVEPCSAVQERKEGEDGKKTQAKVSPMVASLKAHGHESRVGLDKSRTTYSVTEGESNSDQRVAMQVRIDGLEDLQASASSSTTQQFILDSPMLLGSPFPDAKAIVHTPKAAAAAEDGEPAHPDAKSLGPFASSPNQHLREPLGGERDSQVEQKYGEEGAAPTGSGDAAITPKEDSKAARLPTPKEALCGCGILFEIDDCNQLRVSYLVEEGPAHLSGMLQVGDVLTCIDMQDVTNKDICQIAPLLLGPANSTVALGFQRCGAGSDVVVLERRPYPATLLSNETRPSTPGRPRILSLRGCSRGAAGSERSHTSSPDSLATSRSMPMLAAETLAAGSPAQAPMVDIGSSQSANRRAEVPAASESAPVILPIVDADEQESDRLDVRKMRQEALSAQGLISKCIYTARANGVGDSGVRSRCEVSQAAFHSPGSASATSLHPKGVVRWRQDQRAPKRHEAACSTPGCGKAGVYKLAVCHADTRVCSIECKLIFLCRISEPEHGTAALGHAPVPSPAPPQGLPEGWEVCVDARGRQYYLDHNTCTSHWTYCP